MTLSEILIAAGVTPDDLHPDCRFIAQDGDDGFLQEFYVEPNRERFFWRGDFLYSTYILPFIAEDWAVPLSREQFTADYAAHQAAKQ